MNHRPRLIFAALSTASFAAAFAAACVGEDTAPDSPATCANTNLCADGSSTDSPTSTSDTSTTNNPNDGGSDGGNDAIAPPTSGSLLWLRSFGTTTGGDRIRDVVVDDIGDIYMLGSASETVGFAMDGGGPSVTGGDFVAKFNSNGDPLWAKSVTTNLSGSGKLALGPNNSLYLGGHYAAPGGGGAAFFLGGQDTLLPANNGGYDIFVLKIDPSSGAFQSAKSFGSPNYDELRAIGVDADGLPIIFGISPTAAIGSLPAGGFVAKLQSNYNVMWVHQITSDAYNDLLGTDIVRLPNNEIAVVGTYRGTIDVHITGKVAETSGNARTFILRLPAGNGVPPQAPGYYTTIYNASNSVSFAESTTAAAVALGSVPNGAASTPEIAIIGQFHDRVDFSGPTSTVMIGDGGNNVAQGTYVVGMGTSLAPLAFRGVFDGNATDVKQIAVDKDGRIVIAGAFKGNTADYGAGVLASAGDEDGIVAVYDQVLKTVLWSKTLSGVGTETVQGLGVDPSGNVIVVGQFAGTTTFAPGTTLASKNGMTNIFMMKLAH